MIKKTIILIIALLLLFIPTIQSAETGSRDTSVGERGNYITNAQGLFDGGEGIFNEVIVGEPDSTWISCNLISNSTELEAIMYDRQSQAILVYNHEGTLIASQTTPGIMLSENLVCNPTPGFAFPDFWAVGGIFQNDSNSDTATFIAYNVSIGDGWTVTGWNTAQLSNTTTRTNTIIDTLVNGASSYILIIDSEGQLSTIDIEGGSMNDIGKTGNNCLVGFRDGDIDYDGVREYCCASTTGIFTCFDDNEVLEFNETLAGSGMNIHDYAFVNTDDYGVLNKAFAICYHSGASLYFTIRGYPTFSNKLSVLLGGGTNGDCQVSVMDYDANGFADHIGVHYTTGDVGVGSYGTDRFKIFTADYLETGISWENNSITFIHDANYVQDAYLWTGDLDGDGYFDDALMNYNRSHAQLIKPTGETGFTNSTVKYSSYHRYGALMRGTAISDLNQDGFYDYMSNNTFYISPFTANQPPVWTATPGETYVDVPNPICVSVNRTWTALQSGSGFGDHYTNDVSGDRERLSIDYDGDGTIDFIGDYHNYAPEVILQFNAVGVYNSVLYLEDEYNEGDYITTFTTTTVWDGEGCFNETQIIPEQNTTEQDSIGGATESNQEIVQGNTELKQEISSSLAGVGISSSASRTILWMVAMIFVTFLCFKIVKPTGSGGMVIVGFINLFMVIIGWLLGFVTSTIILLIGLFLVLLVVLLMFSREGGG